MSQPLLILVGGKGRGLYKFFIFNLLLITINCLPQISVRRGRHVHVDCLGEPLRSLTAIACATPDECHKMKDCVEEPQSCELERGKELFLGSRCYHDEGQGSCFSIDMEPLVTAGMIQCESIYGDRVVDHFYYGVDAEFHLASHPPKSSLIALQLSSPHGDARGTGERGDLLELYKDETINGKCIVPEFTSTLSPSIDFLVIQKNGGKFKLASSFVNENKIAGLRSVVIRNYRVSEDVTGFYCAVVKNNRAAKRLDLEDDLSSTTVNVTAWRS